MRSTSPLPRDDVAIAKALATYQRAYDPSLALGLTMGLYQGAHKLRGFWPCSSVDENNNLYDFSNQQRGLTSRNSAVTNISTGQIFPYALFQSGSQHYFDRTDEAGLSITGTLTIGCWAYFSTAPASAMGLMGKWGAAIGSRSYRIFKTSANTIQFAVSTDGTNAFTVTTTGTVTINTWYFIIATFLPSTEITVWLASNSESDIEKASNTTSIPATIIDNTQAFELGRTGGAINYLNGRQAFGILAASVLTEDYREMLYHHSRPLFGL